MRRLTIMCLCDLLLMSAVANAACEVCLPFIPCETCVDSCDFGYLVGDRVSTYTHWRADEDTQTLTRTTKVPQMKCATTSTSKCRTVKARVCEPAKVTRTFVSPSFTLEPRCVPVEVAFKKHKCCVDACGRVYACTCDGPNTLVDEPDYHTRRVIRSVEQSAKTIKCREVERVCEFMRVTTECEIDDTDVNVSATGLKWSWTPEPHSVPTGPVTLTRAPAVHVVSGTCAVCPTCPMHCVSCKYTPCNRAPVPEPMQPAPPEQTQALPDPLPTPAEAQETNDGNPPETPQTSPAPTPN